MADMNRYLETLINGDNLTFDQARDILDTIFAGDTPPAQVAAFLTAMRAKHPTGTELAGLATSLREHAVHVDTGIDNLIDTCGTGGAKLKTFNISTAAAIVAAGAGAHVAKHGNRGITSKCGSADVLAALGVNVDPGPEKIARCIRDARIGFMFAPRFHPAMKYVQPVRKELPFRTVFNILGPLANPARAAAQVIGVADESLMNLIAEALKLLKTKRAMVVHSEGLDEISTLGPTKILRLENNAVTEITLDCADCGIPPADFSQLKGDDAETNANIVRDIIAAKDKGPKRDIVLINAAAALIIADLAQDFPAAVARAAEAVDSGKAKNALEKLIEISNS